MRVRGPDPVAAGSTEGAPATDAPVTAGVRGVRFEPPVPGRACIERPRLLDRLQERFTHPVTVVTAPAGMGKTTLLAQAVAAERGAAARVDLWLSCSPDDAAASRLATGLGRGLGVPPLTPVGRPPVDVLADGIWHRSPVEVCLVLDDVHEVPEGSPGADLLARLIAALPRNGHVVLAGRRPPPVPLARLEVQGRVARLGEADLLFTDDERAEFAGQRGVPAERVAACAGWPALSELAASAAPQVEAAYLWEEVLDRLPDARRRDLALLAHVGPFDDELARAALGRDITVAELTADLPLVSATAAGGWQIHGLWRTHLAGAADDDAVAGARRRAGRALAASGDLAAAIRQLAAAEAWDDLTAVVTDALGAAHPPVAGDVVASWLGRLPAHLAGEPVGRLLGAVVNMARDPGAADELQAAADGFRAAGDVDGELACIAHIGQLAWWAQDPTHMGRLTLRLFEMEAAGVEGAVPLACVGRALIADLMADSARVLDELDRIPPGSLRGTWESVVDWLRAMALHHLGRPAEALEAATRAQAAAGPLLAPVIESTRLQARWYLGDLAPAVDGLPRLADQAVAAGLRDNAALIAAGAAMAHAAVGGTDEARRYLEMARRAAATPGAPLVDVYLTVAAAAAAVAAGDEEDASRTLAAYLDRSPPLDTGVEASAQRRSLTLWYVLVPASREAWDAADLGGCFALGRDLARTLVAHRAAARSRSREPALDEPRLVPALLPRPWAVELALGWAASGRAEGWAVLDVMWPGAQADVRRHAAGDGPLAKAARAALARFPVPPAARLEVRLLGTAIELWRDGEPVDASEWRRERVRSLLAALALHHPRPVHRERLALDLWPDLDGEAQSRNLRVTLSHLLRALEPGRAERDASFLVRSHGGALALHECEWLDVDAWRFDRLWQAATAADGAGRPATALAAMVEATGLWRAHPAELALNDWALPAVEQARQRFVSMATRASELLLARGDAGEARRLAGAALDEDPWCERAHTVLIAAHEAEGQHLAARAARRRYEAARQEIGIA